MKKINPQEEVLNDVGILGSSGRLPPVRGFSSLRAFGVFFSFFALLVLGLSARIYVAFQSPDSLSLGQAYVPSDLGVIGLMAKHLIERGEFPFFFWGQNFFGGLESFLHGLAFLQFGAEPWAMRITPLILYALFSITTFLIARDVFNSRIALLSLLWCVFAPSYLTELGVVPHTHYMELPVLGNFILWTAIRLAKAQVPARRRLLYFVLGFWGGLGWWVNPIIVYYILASAAYLILQQRKEAWTHGIAFSLPGFLIGASPFFMYYWLDPYSDMLSMSQTTNWSHFFAGFWRFFLLVGPELMDLFNYQKFGLWASWLLAFFYVYVLISFFRGNTRSFFSLFSWRKPTFQPVGILFFLFLAMLVIYATSENAANIAAPRYVLPLYSFFPLATAYAVWKVSGKFKALSLLVFSFFLFAQGMLIYDWAVYEVPTHEAHARNIRKVIDFLNSKDIHRAYASYYLGSAEITFLSKENIICASPRQERYHPYELILDAAENPAFIDDRPRAFDSVLKVIGGECKTEQVGPYYVYYDFKEPVQSFRQIDPAEIKATASNRSKDMAKVLDRDFSTVWSCNKARTDKMWVNFDLGKTRNVGLIRLWNKGHYHINYSTMISLEVSPDGINWQEILPQLQSDYYYWSGPRIYFWEWGYRWEIRFGPVEARFIRIRQHEASKDPWMIGEAYVYEDFSENIQPGEGEKEILKAVWTLDLTRVYADRWMSAKIQEMSGGKIKTVDPFSYAIAKYYDRVESRVIEWGPKVGFVIEKSDADLFQKTAEKENMTLSRMDSGRWSLFYFANWGEKEEEAAQDPGWYWMGLGMVKINHKLRSDYLFNLGVKREKEGHLEAALDDYEKALKHYSNHQEARQGAIHVLKGLGKDAEAKKQEAILTRQTLPQHYANAEFEKGVVFIGYSMTSELIKPGQAVKVTYYWRLKSDPGRRIGVFVHVDGQGKLIQGDHILLERHVGGVWPALQGEIFHQTEYLRFPSDIPSGEYRLGLGLFDLKTGKRWMVKNTSSENDHNKVLVGTLSVIK
jgi:hypothetical protein